MARVQGTLGDPNLAANYFLISLFVVLACGRPRSRVGRASAVMILLTAVALTGSNGGLVSLCVAVFVVTIAWIWRTRGPVLGIALAALVLCALAALVSSVDMGSLEQRAADASLLLRDSIGRGGESSGTRSTLLHESSALYQQTGLIGIGPGRTKDWLAREGAPYVKEAHSDYTASLVERGALGALGLVVLVITLLRRAMVLLVEPMRPEYTDVVRLPQMLLGAIVVVLVSASFYEVLHFRHVWALFGLIAGAQIWGRARTTP